MRCPGTGRGERENKRGVVIDDTQMCDVSQSHTFSRHILWIGDIHMPLGSVEGDGNTSLLHMELR